MRRTRHLLSVLTAVAAAQLAAGPGLAQQTDGASPAGAQAVLFYALLLAGFFLAGYLGADAFRRRQFQLADLPTLPRYMTRPPLFQLGTAAFVAVCLLIYAIIVAFYRDFLPVVQFFDPTAYEALLKLSQSGAYTTGVLVGIAMFFLLLTKEHRANVLLVLRDAIYSWVAIPRKCSELMTLIRDNLEIPAAAVEQVLSSRYARNLSARDFAKDKETPDRKLAEISYMIWWLRQREKTGDNVTFFAEPSLLWEDVKAAYARVADKVEHDLKGGPPLTYSQADEIFGAINALHAKSLRMVACFLIYDNGDDGALWRSANQFGVVHDARVIRNPASSCIVYACAVMLTTYLSVSLAAVLFDWMVTGSLAQAFAHVDAVRTWRWVAYAVAIYCVPLVALLVARFVTQQLNPREAPARSMSHYAIAFLASMALATLTLAVMLKLLSPRAAASGVFDLMSNSVRWSLAPAIAGVYVVYCLDTVSEHVALTARAVGLRLLAGLGLGALFVLFAAFPTAGITLPEGDTWTVGKAQFVTLASTFAIGFVVGALATFGRLVGGATDDGAAAATGEPSRAPGVAPTAVEPAAAHAGDKPSLAVAAPGSPPPRLSPQEP